MSLLSISGAPTGNASRRSTPTEVVSLSSSSSEEEDDDDDLEMVSESTTTPGNVTPIQPSSRYDA